MDRTIDVLGREDAVRCWHDAMGIMVERPLLRPLIAGAKAFLSEPGSRLALIEKGWSLAYRDFCAPRFEALGETACRIAFEDVAPEAFRSPGYLHCWHAICLGMFDLEEVSARHVQFETDEAGRRAVATLRWG
jgi:hypothetical protein